MGGYRLIKIRPVSDKLKRTFDAIETSILESIRT